MCGIFGVINNTDAYSLTKKGIGILKPRGRDAEGYHQGKDLCLGHCLHAVVGTVKQPLTGKGILVSNNEIYNWEAINTTEGYRTRNDSETMCHLFSMKGVSDEVLSLLDGVYAFAYLEGDVLFLARDILGVKPLWYSHSEGFAFSSEKKALEEIGRTAIQELNPRKIIRYDIGKDHMGFIDRKFFSLENPIKAGIGSTSEKVRELLKSAIQKRVPERKFGLLFSGGIDSTYIAMTLKNLGYGFTCYTCVLGDDAKKEPEDLRYARTIAKELGLTHKIITVPLDEVPLHLKEIVPLIEDSNVVKVEVALTFHAACREAAKDGCKVIFTGLGSEEIFAGYQRHKDSNDINRECISGLLKLYERDLYRDDVITMHNGLEGRFPFLDKELVKYALRIPGDFKLRPGTEKYILRKIAQDEGLPKEFSQRKKRAAQYGSNFSKAIATLTKKAGHNLKSEYLRTFYPAHNLVLGALVSSGKDSIYAMHVMLRQNYRIGCMISMKSENLDSYMFHTPTIDLAKLQSKATGIPLVIGMTKGEKEKELDDLKETLTIAKKKHGIQGVVTGALYSNYQRERIDKVCESLQLKVFSPLWHINQETEMREILSSGFTFILTKVAAEGLDKSWLGKPVTLDDIDRLANLKKTIGINVAGEGGEFESLMVDGPIFTKRIVIEDAYIAEETKNLATLIIKKAGLEMK